MRKPSGEHENLDTELNIVPIIDCFVMLICFLLFTAAFTQLVFLEAKLTSNTMAAATKSRSELDQFRAVVTFEDKGLRLTTTGSAAKKVNSFIGMKENEYDFASLHYQLIALKTDHPDRFSIDIEFKQKQADAVNYEKIMKTIDSVRHLNDDEYSSLKLAQRKMRNMEIEGSEKEKVISEEITRLAQSMMTNEVSKETDHKLLFPDVAMVGLD